MLELGLAVEITGVLESWNPFAVDEHCVPADMVDMQMRTHHVIDALAGIAGFGNVGKERCL